MDRRGPSGPRPAPPGSTLFLTDGNARGVGKGLLADVAALVPTGGRFAVTNDTSDRAGLRKRITALVMEGEELVSPDNLSGAVGSDILGTARPGGRWMGRMLGASRTYDGPLGITRFGTGSTVRSHADTSRRTCHVPRHRGRLPSAALMVLPGWVVAGRPTHGPKPWGTFEGWSAVVPEAVVSAGPPDPGVARDGRHPHRAGPDRRHRPRADDGGSHRSDQGR